MNGSVFEGGPLRQRGELWEACKKSSRIIGSPLRDHCNLQSRQQTTTIDHAHWGTTDVLFLQNGTWEFEACAKHVWVHLSPRPSCHLRATESRVRHNFLGPEFAFLHAFSL